MRRSRRSRCEVRALAAAFRGSDQSGALGRGEMWLSGRVRRSAEYREAKSACRRGSLCTAFCVVSLSDVGIRLVGLVRGWRNDVFYDDPVNRSASFDAIRSVNGGTHGTDGRGLQGCRRINED